MPADPKAYLEYLDKEMTIMGVLSAFAASALAAVLWKLTDADPDKHLLASELSTRTPWFIIGATVLNLFSALAFYRQRSLLAWYYGQIALDTSVVQAPATSVDVLLHSADGWDTWIHHWRGWAWLSLGFVGYGIAFSAALIRPQPPTVSVLLWAYTVASIAVVVVVELFVAAAKSEPQSEDPFEMRSLFPRLRRFRTRK